MNDPTYDRRIAARRDAARARKRKARREGTIVGGLALLMVAAYLVFIGIVIAVVIGVAVFVLRAFGIL